MKIIFLTGTHPRHAHIANAINRTGFLSGLIIEKREDHVLEAPKNLNEDLKFLFNLHFKKRRDSEKKFFKENNFPKTNTLNISKDELNSSKTIQFIKEIEPDLIMSYGVHKLSDDLINSCKGEAWNIHGGLSPWYRGVATHFWPSYFLEPQMTGMTIHDLTQHIDGGDIIHQNSATLVQGDSLHDLSCRAVKEMADDLNLLIDKFKNNKIVKFPQTTSGRIWITRDWRPEHLRMIYEYNNDKIVDLVINGRITGKIPKIIRQF